MPDETTFCGWIPGDVTHPALPGQVLAHWHRIVDGVGQLAPNDVAEVLDALAARTAERDDWQRKCAVAENDVDRLKEYLSNLGMEMPELL